MTDDPVASLGGAPSAAPLETIRQEAEQFVRRVHYVEPFDRAVDLLEAFARRWYQRGHEDARVKPACVHGHTKRVVGCVSCVLVFDREAP